MRRALIILVPLTFCASPALAQESSPPQLPHELTDPATAQRLTDAMQVLSKALMNIKIGEVQAALEGRHPGAQERNLTVRELARRHDPDFDRHFQQQIASVGPTVERSMKALDEALPQIMQGLDQAKRAIDRAAANMPDPNYPRR